MYDAVAYVIRLIALPLHETWERKAGEWHCMVARADEADLTELTSWVSICDSSRLS